ncbi:hypothetical protein H4W33_010656 [Kibdelosporangium phytohabitans]|nr:hypothetical protein [Kibdelosporangium phytohabitans]
MTIPTVRSRRGTRRRKPAKFHGDKAYDHIDLRRWARDQGIAVRITRKGIESSTKLGKHRWVIERTIAWLFGYHRFKIRYANHFCVLLTLTCYKKLRKQPHGTRAHSAAAGRIRVRAPPAGPSPQRAERTGQRALLRELTLTEVTPDSATTNRTSPALAWRSPPLSYATGPPPWRGGRTTPSRV